MCLHSGITSRRLAVPATSSNPQAAVLSQVPHCLSRHTRVILRSGQTSMPIFGLGTGAPDDSQELISRALRRGYRLVDTGELYGNVRRDILALRMSHEAECKVIHRDRAHVCFLTCLHLLRRQPSARRSSRAASTATLSSSPPKRAHGALAPCPPTWRVLCRPSTELTTCAASTPRHTAPSGAASASVAQMRLARRSIVHSCGWGWSGLTSTCCTGHSRTRPTHSMIRATRSCDSTRGESSCDSGGWASCVVSSPLRVLPLRSPHPLTLHAAITAFPS